MIGPRVLSVRAVVFRFGLEEGWKAGKIRPSVEHRGLRRELPGGIAGMRHFFYKHIIGGCKAGDQRLDAT